MDRPDSGIDMDVFIQESHQATSDSPDPAPSFRDIDDIDGAAVCVRSAIFYGGYLQ
jgi:hypothetical protein